MAVGSSPRKGGGTVKTAKRPHPMRTVSDADLARSLSEMVTPIAGIPPAEMAAWFESMRAYARRQHPDALCPMGPLAGAWMRIAQAVWKEWPRQEHDE